MTRRRVDNNQREIVQALEQAGYFVTDLSAVGNGCPDLLVASTWGTFLVEVKRNDRKYYFTPAQIEYHAATSAPIYVIKSVDDVISFVSGELKAVNKPLKPQYVGLKHGSSEAEDPASKHQG
jgi:hypothetical protein